MIFEKKKIQIETLSEYLASVRGKLGFSEEAVVAKTGISLKFLQALEKGDFKILPADVYVLGFLRQLSQIYSVDLSELINQYKKEKGIVRQLSKQAGMLDSAWYQKYFNKLVITPKVLSLALGALFVTATVGYIIWQVWSINKIPNLQVFEPVNNAVVQNASVKITGQTDPGMEVRVNGQNVFVDNKGAFQAQLGLNQGPEEITITAQNRFGKSVSKIINITGAASLGPGANQLILKVDFSGSVTLGFVVDNQPAQSLSFNSGDSKTFTAKQKILLSTTDAGATKVTLNGQILGAMGKPKEQLSNVAFSAQAATLK